MRATEKVDYVAYEPVMPEVSKARTRALMLEQLADGDELPKPGQLVKRLQGRIRLGWLSKGCCWRSANNDRRDRDAHEECP